ncbi:MAG: Gldg family protein [Lachnospiraceae bacterium]|nr:Gldg family protein [Lachnospiraceae bacterium]
MFAIYKRELKSYLYSFIGFLFIAATLFFLGLYFNVYNVNWGYPYVSYALASVIFLFLISVPILTMRVLAEERRNKTDQLILTAPVSVGSIVIGKFLALMTIFTIPVAVFCIYPFILNLYGDMPLSENVLSILAYFLFGMTAIAIGLFVSSLTESQVISAVISFALIFVGYMMPSICSVFSTTGNLLTAILSCYDLDSPFYALLGGTLDLTAVVYYLSITILMLFLTVQSIQKRRYSVSVKNIKFGAYSSGMIVVAFIVTVLVNVVVREMPVTWTSFDWTGEKMYSLTDQTKEYVKTIDEDVTIYVLCSESSQDTTLEQTLKRYDDLSKYIDVEYVDPNVNPMFASNYTDVSLNSNSLIIESAKRSTVIDYSDIYEVSYTFNQSTYTYDSETTGYDGEGQITSALDYVLADDVPKTYILTGHGEIELGSTFESALTKSNIEFETINLMDVDSVPEDASSLVINGISSDLSEDDEEKLEEYLNNGGKILISIEYGSQETPNIDKLLDYMGLYKVPGVVVEQSTGGYYRSPYYILPSKTSSAYTSGIGSNYYIFAPNCVGIVVPEEDSDTISYNTFLSTSDRAFAKSDAEAASNYDKGENDVDGPFAVGVEAVKTLDDGTATMVVYASGEIFTEAADQIVSGVNMTLFTNTVSSFEEKEVNISIPVKSYAASYISVPQVNMLLFMVFAVILLPLGCLAAGFVIWLRRRKR